MNFETESEKDECEPEQRREFLNASVKLQDLLVECVLGQVRHVQPDHHGRRGAEPSSGRRLRHAQIRGDSRVPGAVNEFAQPMVGALLRTGRRHGLIIGSRMTVVQQRSEKIRRRPP